MYRERRLIATWRVPTAASAAGEARGIIAGMPAGDVEGVCVCSVVPSIERSLERILKRRVSRNVLFATPDTIGMPIVGYRRKEIGADRLVNALAAYHRYNRALIIVDFGTATTFDVVTSDGAYIGGAIAPGINLANRSLHDYTAKLPHAPIKRTKRLIGHRTVESMQAGVFHGYAGLVNHLVRGIAKEMHARPKVIATGGLAKLIAPSTDVISTVHDDLTLEGLRLVWERNNSSR